MILNIYNCQISLPKKQSADKKLILVFMFLFISVLQLLANTSPISGAVSYISSTHVYVKFSSTQGISIGDTLYKQDNQKLLPVLKVQKISSLSCMGVRIDSHPVTVGDVLLAFPKPVVLEKAGSSVDVPVEVKAEQQIDALPVTEVLLNEKAAADPTPVSGRISVASYSRLSSDLYNYQRIKYTLSLNTGEKEEPGLSTETYLAYNQKFSDRTAFQHDVKIYSLAVNYQLNQTTKLSLGRKLNPGMANIGAVDGLQVQFRKGRFNMGAIAGSRPDMQNYGYNFNLFQVGAYTSHEFSTKKSNFQTTLAVMNQMNDWQTDRRFVYLQHSNQLNSNFSMFGSVEVDLYALENGQPNTTFDFTGGFLSLRYKFSPRFSLTANYDARKNVYYYETYKNIADSIFDKETRQGLRLQFRYRLTPELNWTGSLGYRMPVANGAASVHGNTSFVLSDLFNTGGDFSVRAMGIRTEFLDGIIAGGDYTYDFAGGRLSLSGDYEYVNYVIRSNKALLIQHLAELRMNWRIDKKWMVSFSGETTFEQRLKPSARLFLNLTRRL